MRVSSVYEPRAKSEALVTNRVYHGDVLEGLEALQNQAEESIFDVVIADPPYNIGKCFGNNYDSLELSDYLEWTDKWLTACMRLAKPDAPIFVYGFPEILAHIAVRYPLKKQRWMVWHYTNKTVPSLKFWQRSHESILCLWRERRPVIDVDAVREDYTDSFLKGAAGKVRNGTLCRYSRNNQTTLYNAHPGGALPRDVFKVPALAGGSGYNERWFFCKTCDRLCSPRENKEHVDHNVIKHPTQKPAQLTHRLISSVPSAAPEVLIPFAGSGSECVVCQAVGANFYAIELNPKYVLLANEWLEKEKYDKPA